MVEIPPHISPNQAPLCHVITEKAISLSKQWWPPETRDRGFKIVLAKLIPINTDTINHVSNELLIQKNDLFPRFDVRTNRWGFCS